MTERWELVELIGQRLEERNLTASEETAEAILDGIDSLIRADERKRVAVTIWRDGYAAATEDRKLEFPEQYADLRAKVEQLRATAHRQEQAAHLNGHRHDKDEHYGERQAYNRVLAMLR